MVNHENKEIDHINPEFSLQEQMTRLNLSDFGHIVQKPSSLKKAIILDKKENKRTPRSRVDGFDYSNVGCTVGRVRLWNRSSWRRSVWVVVKSQH